MKNNLLKKNLDMKQLKIRIHSIVEGEFSIDKSKIPLSKEDCENIVHPFFQLSFNANEKENLFSSICLIGCQKKEKDSANEIIVGLNFKFNLLIENLSEFIIETNSDHVKYSFSDSFYEILSEEVTSTGRALLSLKLSDTILKDYYIPFGAGRSLAQQIKDQIMEKVHS